MKTSIITAVLSVAFLVSCQGPADNTQNNQETFEQHVADFKSHFLEGFASKNLELQHQFFADSVQWSGPTDLLNQSKGKAELMEVIAYYHEHFDNIEFTDGAYYGGSLYSTEETSDSPDNIRIYGNWKSTHKASGKQVLHKWYAFMSFDKDGRVYQINDWFNVSGIPLQVSGELVVEE
ncbi:MAG: nuclear transport factor 2 family protein [Lutibacter sp.]|jgi:hypothetical protein|nr:nuclear transport factor 2 family protein [Lutibacter sp.]